MEKETSTIVTRAILNDMKNLPRGKVFNSVKIGDDLVIKQIALEFKEKIPAYTQACQEFMAGYKNS